MSTATLVKFKFKPGQKQAWLDWSEELKRRREEVIVTLKNEGVLSESCYISEDGEYVYYLMEVEDLEKALQVFAASNHPIDNDHRKVLDSSLERVANFDCLFHFDNRE
ncbi:MAG: DUF6176 family protein [Patescibacteria group bacterium]